MTSTTSQYSYTSQLPLMFTLVDKGRIFRPGDDSLTRKQRTLWRKVAENKERVLQSNLHHDSDPAIQEYQLELWTWNHFWPEVEFPGPAPERIEVEDTFLGNPDSSNVKLETGSEHEITHVSYAPSSLLSQHYPFHAEARMDLSHDMFTHPSTSPPAHAYIEESSFPYTPSPLLRQHHPFKAESMMYSSNNDINHPPPSPATRHYPTIQPVSVESLRAECREAILQHKGADYVPYHGWDEETGLPPYSILCRASNGFVAFCGPHQQYFLAIKTHFSPVARIMYQRVRTGLMIIWIEAPKIAHVAEFRTNARLWNEFKACWAFLKTWTDAAGEGGADSVDLFLGGWRGEGVGEGVRMEFPDLRVWQRFGRE